MSTSNLKSCIVFYKKLLMLTADLKRKHNVAGNLARTSIWVEVVSILWHHLVF